MPQEHKNVEENSGNKNYPFNTARIFDPNDKLLSLPEVQYIVPLSKSRIYHLLSEGSFPAPIKIGQVRSCWLSSEIHEYVQKRLDERNSKQLLKEGAGTMT
jgi:prophage regulatory protein